VARTFYVEDLQDGYVEILWTVIRDGDKTAPRGLATREVRDATIVVQDPENGVPTAVGRKLNRKIGAAETAQLIAGVSDLAQLDSASSGRFSRYADGGRLRGAYGPRLYNQLGPLITKLSDDPDTRQAHAVIWRPDDNRRETKDLPCTISLGFAIRKDRLYMTTHMRSNDIWLGLPYDAWMFTRLQMTLAYCLGIEIGTYTHMADSLHIYDSNLLATESILVQRGGPRFTPPSFAPLRNMDGYVSEDPLTRLMVCRTAAEVAVRGSYRRGSEDIVDPWYYDTLHPHVSLDSFKCLSCRYIVRNDQMSNQAGTCLECGYIG